MSLWKFNIITGYWTHVRVCQVGTAQLWLEQFQKDEPEEFYILSNTKPTHDPRNS